MGHHCICIFFFILPFLHLINTGQGLLSRHFPSIGNPTETYFYGTQITTILLGFFLAAFFVNLIILPIFYNLKMVSLNEVRKSGCFRHILPHILFLIIRLLKYFFLYHKPLAPVGYHGGTDGLSSPCYLA